MFKFRKIFIVVFFVVLLFPMAGETAGKPVELYFFEGQGCPHCAKMKSYLEGLKVDYPNLIVKDFEVYFNKENQDLLTGMLTAYKTNIDGVPILFIGDEVIVGEAYEKLKNAVAKCSEEGCVSPADKLGSVDANTNTAVNTNNNQPDPDGSNKNEIVGWVVIGIFVAVGIGLITHLLKGNR